ncbi:hypothetical protein CEXT_358631 [Caerostris extrusa]|uniref:Uncharacterized protein n=1 Tax=Caerostris extrusa TaxID=172846 RepID=A0AAV4QQ32_CAEEX|nr:hypothetical protein CEXT_358631 [Caerostris extrusa]
MLLSDAESDECGQSQLPLNNHYTLHCFPPLLQRLDGFVFSFYIYRYQMMMQLPNGVMCQIHKLRTGEKARAFCKRSF